MEAGHTPSEFAAVAAERDALRKFKEWVHAYLDNLGVPHDPDPEHTARHGCRISGRMNYLVRQRDDLLAACEELLANADAKQDDRESCRRLYDAWRSIRTAVAEAKGGGT
jgi:hypothetical protein